MLITSGTGKVLEDLIVPAVRYGLTRHTYIVATIADDIT